MPGNALGGSPCFVLVHGAFHGAWCWDHLRPELTRRGCAVVAVDLPIDDAAAGAEDYAAAVVTAVPGAEPVVVVGHSLAGLTIPLLPTLIPVKRLVFLCAMLPQPGLSFDEQHADMDSGFVPSETARANPDGSASWPQAGAIEMFYHDCPLDIASWAASRLRPQHWTITREVTPLSSWPATPMTSIVARDDRVVAPDYCRTQARDRLGVEPLEVGGGHSPFLSRPVELADMLVHVAADDGANPPPRGAGTMKAD
jgi:hypothetical protein